MMLLKLGEQPISVLAALATNFSNGDSSTKRAVDGTDLTMELVVPSPFQYIEIDINDVIRACLRLQSTLHNRDQDAPMADGVGGQSGNTLVQLDSLIPIDPPLGANSALNNSWAVLVAHEIYRFYQSPEVPDDGPQQLRVNSIEGDPVALANILHYQGAEAKLSTAEPLVEAVMRRSSFSSTQ